MAIIIETERIALRKFTLEDAADVLVFNSNEEVMRLTGDKILHSLEEAINVITDVWFSDYKLYGYGRYAAIYKPENKLIGFAGLKYEPNLKATDIGYRFLPKYWGKGIATEISLAIMKYGFDELKLDRIIGVAMPENLASAKVLEKIGLTYFKTDGFLGDGGKYLWYEAFNPNKISNPKIN